MGSSHFGELGLGSGRSSSSGSSRKGKKSSSSSSEKPKQPQRGLGVAQLEKIRLHNQMAGHLPSLHHHPPPFHSNPNKEDDVRIEMGFSSSSPPPPPSSSYAATSSSSLFPLHPNTMMGFGEADQRRDTRFGEFQSSSPTRPLILQHNSTFMPYHWGQQTVTLPLLEQNIEDVAQKKRRHDRSNSMGSMSQNSDSSDTQELDLDLKLSL